MTGGAYVSYWIRPLSFRAWAAAIRSIEIESVVAGGALTCKVSSAFCTILVAQGADWVCRDSSVFVLPGGARSPTGWSFQEKRGRTTLTGRRCSCGASAAFWSAICADSIQRILTLRAGWYTCRPTQRISNSAWTTFWVKRSTTTRAKLVAEAAFSQRNVPIFSARAYIWACGSFQEKSLQAAKALWTSWTCARVTWAYTCCAYFYWVDRCSVVSRRAGIVAGPV